MSDHNVTIYSTAACPHCINAKKYLDSKDVKYTNHDVAQDKEKRAEMVQKSGQMGVPVIEIDGKIVVGFDITEINKTLGL